MPSRNDDRIVRAHRVPDWWRDAKLGIFVHWTPASVPGFAPTTDEIGELVATRDPTAFAHSPYAEWYENSMRFPDSPVSKHHAATYGDRPYAEFARDWEAGLAQWDPDAWAASFAATGARYVVLVTKHHDGYCLWPTQVDNPHRRNWHSERDVVGELATAVRRHGMRFGIYYSGGLDSRFNDHAVGAFSDFILALPRGDYPPYAEAQVRELIERYAPSVLWNDISWPASTTELATLLRGYYDAVPDGVINDRFLCWSPAWRLARLRAVRRMLDGAAASSARKGRGVIPPKPRFYDIRTPEYTVFDDIQRTPWECVRGMDHSFGFNRASEESDFLRRDELLWSLIDIAAKGGNLLLNVGPRGEDAQIPEPQLTRLDWLASFTTAHGDRLFGTRPWVHADDDTAGFEVRYLGRGDDVCVFVRSSEQVTGPSPELVLGRVLATPATRVIAGDGTPLPHRMTDSGLTIGLASAPPRDAPVSFVLAAVEPRRAA
jgi:alpha-L-fucosidase